MIKRLAFGVVVVLLAGCQEQKPAISVTTEPEAQPRIPLTPATTAIKRSDPKNPSVWGRQDCKPLTGTAEKASFASDKAACEVQEKVGRGAPAEKIYYCMSDKGYNYRSAADHAAACTGR